MEKISMDFGHDSFWVINITFPRTQTRPLAAVTSTSHNIKNRCHVNRVYLPNLNGLPDFRLKKTRKLKLSGAIWGPLFLINILYEGILDMYLGRVHSRTLHAFLPTTALLLGRAVLGSLSTLPEPKSWYITHEYYFSLQQLKGEINLRKLLGDASREYSKYVHLNIQWIYIFFNLYVPLLDV